MLCLHIQTIQKKIFKINQSNIQMNIQDLEYSRYKKLFKINQSNIQMHIQDLE
jgi:hypothetical protein